MTFIAGLLTPKYVAFVSDRRITRARSSTAEGNASPVIESQEDTDTKVAILDRRYALGYSGRPNFGVTRQKMEYRLAALLASTPADAYFETIRQHLTEEFVKSYVRNTPPHHFLAMGYSRTGEAETVVISNCFDGNSRVQTSPTVPLCEFAIRRVPLEARPYALWTIGSAVPPADDSWARGEIKKMLKRDDNDPRQAVGILTALARKVAALSDGSVGDISSETTFPRRAVPLVAPTMIVGGAFPSRSVYRKDIVSLTVGPSGTPSSTSWQPAFICEEFVTAGGQSAQNVSGYLGPPPDSGGFDILP